MERSKASLSVDFTINTIECDCGEEFAVLAIIRNKDMLGMEIDTQYMEQTNSIFCPFCGKRISDDSAKD